MLEFINDNINNELLHIQIEELQFQLNELKTKKNKYKYYIKSLLEERRRDEEIMASWNVSSLEEITDIIRDSSNHICQIHIDDAEQDLHDQAYNDAYDNALYDILIKYSFDSEDGLRNFVETYRNHKCKIDVKYLKHKELLMNNYYSQMINTNHILNEQLKDEKKRYDVLYSEVVYLRNLYMNDSEKRKHNMLLDENIIIDRPIKVTFNKAYYDKYFKLLLNNKEKEKPKINKGFVLYRFKNIVNRVIYRNKKQRFVNKIKSFINNMNVYLKNRRPKKVTIGDALYLRYKKERLLNNINKVKLVKNKIILINKIKKYLTKYRKQKRKGISVLEKNKKIIDDIINSNIKYKNSIVYNRLYQSNRDTIDLYSGYYEDYVLKKKKDEIKLIQECYDKNSSRFLRILELFNLIKKDEQLYNSDYIFNYYKLSDVNKKDDGFNLFINKLKDELFVNSTEEPIIGYEFFDDEINNNIQENISIDKKEVLNTPSYLYECRKCKIEFNTNFEIYLKIFRICNNCDL